VQDRTGVWVVIAKDGTVITDTSVLGSALQADEPRVRFHAFRDSRVSQLVNRDTAIQVQAKALWQIALEQKNPGVFLHFLQDESSHSGYSSNVGHLLDNHKPDYLSNDATGVTVMVALTASKLSEFMQANSLTQALRTGSDCDPSAIQPLVDRLVTVNPAPGLSSSPPTTSLADYELTRAVTQRADTTPYRLFSQRDPYTFDAAGRTKQTTFAVYGKLRASVSGATSDVDVSVWAAPTRKIEKPYQLACKRATASVEFSNLPVGNLIVQVASDGVISRRNVTLANADETVSLNVAAASKQAASNECQRAAQTEAELCTSANGDGPAGDVARSQNLESQLDQQITSCQTAQTQVEPPQLPPATEHAGPQCDGLAELDRLLRDVNDCKRANAGTQFKGVKSCLDWWRGYPVCSAPVACTAQVDRYYAFLTGPMGMPNLKSVSSGAMRAESINGQLHVTCDKRLR
jgi:hypothetical protein